MKIFASNFKPNVHLTVENNLIIQKKKFAVSLARPFKIKTTLKTELCLNFFIDTMYNTKWKKIQFTAQSIASNVPLALERTQKMAALLNRFTCVFNALTFRFIICVYEVSKAARERQL